MVGDEPAGTDDHPAVASVTVVTVTTVVTGGAEFVDHLEDVGADPRFRGAARRLPRDRPVRSLVESETVGDGLGGRAQFVGVRVALVDDSPWQRVSREQHTHGPVGGGSHGGESGAEVVGEEVEIRRLGRPTLDVEHRRRSATVGHPSAAPVEVLADRVRREVRRQHQPDDGLRSGGGIPCGLLDLGGSVLQAEGHREAARFVGIQRGLQRPLLGLGQLGEGRQPADGAIAGGEVGECLRGRRPAAANVGVVGLDLRRCTRRSVRHQDHRDRHETDVCSCTRSTTACSTPGSESGWTPWPRLKMCPGDPPLSANTCRAPASATGAPARTSAGSRLP